MRSVLCFIQIEEPLPHYVHLTKSMLRQNYIKNFLKYIKVKVSIRKSTYCHQKNGCINEKSWQQLYTATISKSLLAVVIIPIVLGYCHSFNFFVTKNVYCNKINMAIRYIATVNSVKKGMFPYQYFLLPRNILVATYLFRT